MFHFPFSVKFYVLWFLYKPQRFCGSVFWLIRTNFRVRSYRFTEDTEETLIEELSQIATFVLDKSEHHILIDTKLHGLRLWDLRTRSLLRTFIGAPHQDFIIHSCFGGFDQSYIITGAIGTYFILMSKLSRHTDGLACFIRITAVIWLFTSISGCF